MVALGALLATTATPHAQQSAALRGGLDTELAGGRPGAGPAVRDRARAQPVRRGPPGAGVAPRPRLQNFRSLEKAPNTAVVAPRPVTPTPDEAGAVPRVRPPEITAGLPPVPVPRRRRTAEADPYAPLGIGIGSLRLFPAEETAVGYTDNATGGSGRQKKGSVLYRAGGRLSTAPAPVLAARSGSTASPSPPRRCWTALTTPTGGCAMAARWTRATAT
jgi:hypothetical protein